MSANYTRMYGASNYLTSKVVICGPCKDRQFANIKSLLQKLPKVGFACNNCQYVFTQSDRDGYERNKKDNQEAEAQQAMVVAVATTPAATIKSLQYCVAWALELSWGTNLENSKDSKGRLFREYLREILKNSESHFGPA